MSELKIYNNGEDQILMSAGDRIIRQPYEFGKSHRTPASTYPLSMPLFNDINGDFTIIVIGIPLEADRGHWGVYNNGLINQNNQVISGHMNSTGPNYNFWKNEHSGFPQFAGGKINGLIYACAAYSNGLLRFVNNTTNLIVSINTTLIDRSNPIFRIGSTFSATSTRAGLNFKTAEVYIFNRALAANEIQYHYNNGLSNNLQNTTGLIHKILLDTYEILDFSVLQDSSDMGIGFRNIITTRNLKQGGLPGGTLQEQLNWANGNLSILFIS